MFPHTIFSLSGNTCRFFAVMQRSTSIKSVLRDGLFSQRVNLGCKNIQNANEPEYGCNVNFLIILVISLFPSKANGPLDLLSNGYIWLSVSVLLPDGNLQLQDGTIVHPNTPTVNLVQVKKIRMCIIFCCFSASIFGQFPFHLVSFPFNSRSYEWYEEWLTEVKDLYLKNWLINKTNQ